MQQVWILSFCFQNTMNLPPDKVKILSQYDNEKKWDLICDQVSLSSRFTPAVSATRPVCHHFINSSDYRLMFYQYTDTNVNTNH